MMLSNEDGARAHMHALLLEHNAALVVVIPQADDPAQPVGALVAGDESVSMGAGADALQQVVDGMVKRRSAELN
jgi:hypothetical protein